MDTELKSPVREAVAEIRNADIGHSRIVRELKDGAITVESAFIRLEREWDRVRLALKVCREEGL